MITPEVIYEKTKVLDKHTLQEVADFVDFLTTKNKNQQLHEEMNKYFPRQKSDSPQPPEHTGKVLSVEEMDAAIEYEAGLRK